MTWMTPKAADESCALPVKCPAVTDFAFASLLLKPDFRFLCGTPYPLGPLLGQPLFVEPLRHPANVLGVKAQTCHELAVGVVFVVMCRVSHASIISAPPLDAVRRHDRLSR